MKFLFWTLVGIGVEEGLVRSMIGPDLFLHLKEGDEDYGKAMGLKNVRCLVKVAVTRKDQMLCQEHFITSSGRRWVPNLKIKQIKNK